MDIKQAQSISGLVKKLDELQGKFERCEYFRDNFKRCSIEVETEAKRSGTYYIDISKEQVYDLLNQELDHIGNQAAEIREKILQLQVQDEQRRTSS